MDESLETLLQKYRDERAAYDRFDSEFTPNPYSPWSAIEPVAAHRDGPATVLQLLRGSDRDELGYACHGAETLKDRCTPELLAQLEALTRHADSYVNSRAKQAIAVLDPERADALGFHRDQAGVDATARVQLTGPRRARWLELALREGDEKAGVEALQQLGYTLRNHQLDEPLTAVLRAALRSPSSEIRRHAIVFLSWAPQHEPLDALIEAMALGPVVLPERVAADPTSEMLVKVLAAKGELGPLSELLMRRRCAGLRTDPSLCRATLRERLLEQRERAFHQGSSRDLGVCVRELADPELLPVCVSALAHRTAPYDALKAAMGVYGQPAIDALSALPANVPGAEQVRWLLDALKKPFPATLDSADRYFGDGKIDDWTGSAFYSYAEVLQLRPSAHAAFQCAWIDRAWGAPVPPSRVDWIRSLGFRDGAFLEELATPVPRPLWGIRAHLRRPEGEALERVLEAGLPSLAFAGTRDARYREQTDAHLARVRRASA
ncbi:MAG: hypothetical protein QM723_13410 [Myxococcaceae bacterium]